MNVTRIVAAVVAVGFVAGSAIAQTAAAAAPAAPKAEAKDAAFLSQGTWLFGFNAGYSSVDLDGAASADATLLQVAGEVNYFVIDNLSVGLSANMDWLRIDSQVAGTGNATLMYGELVGRYYFPLCKNRIIPYVGASAGAGYGWFSIKNAMVHADQDNTVTDWGAQAGFLVPLNESVMLDTCFKYNQYKLPNSWATDMDAMKVLLGLKIKM
jgi:outer membrane protein W